MNEIPKKIIGDMTPILLRLFRLLNSKIKPATALITAVAV
jgi:hypothetical protein